MLTRNGIQAQGTVIEVLSSEVYRLELANGHQCVAGISKEIKNNATSFLPGDKVLIVFQPYDLSRGRIVLPTTS